MQVGAYNSNTFYGTAAQGYGAYGGSASAAQTNASDGKPKQDAAAVVTLSDAARNVTAELDFAQIVESARETLSRLLNDADRDSPLKEGKLALDMSALNQRELFAISSTEDALFTSSEREAAALEAERRFGLALSGPLAVSEVTGDFRPLYRAASEYLDGLGTEQKAEPEWEAARNAIDTALAQLDGDRSKRPEGIENDPVAAWLAARTDSDDTGSDTQASLAQNLRNALDKHYDAAHENGRIPTFDASKSRGHHIDLAEFDAETVSMMALNRDNLFSMDEIRAAEGEIRHRASNALSEGYREAAKSGDPTAFAQNIISLYSSLSPSVREAAGFQERMLSTAMASYESTSQLMNMMQQGMQASSGVGSWFSSR